jgi:ABC-type branched-subunit amino acid transport system substrate-binding protein
MSENFPTRSPRIRTLVWISLFFVVLADNLSAQQSSFYNDTAEQNFRRGLELFTARDYVRAYAKFADVIDQKPRNQRTTAAYIMGAKALFEMKDFNRSIQLLKTFLQSFPASKYVPDARFTLGMDFYAGRRYEDAVGEFLQVLDHPGGKSLWEKADSLIDNVSTRHLDSTELDRLLNVAATPRTKFLIALKIAEKKSADGKKEEARALLNAYLQRYPENKYASRARELLKTVEKKSAYKIGVVLPLFKRSADANVKEIGSEILQGIEFASEELRATRGVEVDLRVFDSEGDPAEASSAVRALSAEKDVIAILGPVYSPEVSTAARVSSENGIPLVTPTATANGLTLIGRDIFQANPDYELRGKAMARCSVEKLKLKSFAVLAPSDSYGKFMAESFITELQRLGAELMGAEWYQKGTTEFREPLMHLRGVAFSKQAEDVVSFAGKMSSMELKKLSSYGVSRALLDSLIAARGKIGVNLLFGKDGKRVADSLHIPTVKDLSNVDSLDIPITGIEGIYLPIAGPEEIGILSSQLAYYNFKTQLLGSGEWYNPVELDANRRYLDGVIFESDTYVEPTDPAYLKFFDSFYQAKNVRPTKNTLFGYDTARLLLSVIADGAASREAVAAKLIRVKDFRGLRTKLSFNERRVNSVLNILQYKGGEVQKLDEILVGDDR